MKSKCLFVRLFPATATAAATATHLRRPAPYYDGGIVSVHRIIMNMCSIFLGIHSTQYGEVVTTIPDTFLPQ